MSGLKSLSMWQMSSCMLDTGMSTSIDGYNESSENQPTFGINASWCEGKK